MSLLVHTLASVGRAMPFSENFVLKQENTGCILSADVDVIVRAQKTSRGLAKII